MSQIKDNCFSCPASIQLSETNGKVAIDPAPTFSLMHRNRLTFLDNHWLSLQLWMRPAGPIGL